MNKLLLGLAAVATLATAPALAADMPVKARPAVVEAAYNWSGFYTASTLGIGWQRVRGDFVDPTLPPDRHNANRTTGWYDSHIGFQWQFNSIVIGAEGAWATPLDRAFGGTFSPSPDCFGASAIPNRICESRVSSVWSAVAKLGLAFDRWMIYGVGGWASAKIETRDRVANTGLVNVQENTDYRHKGWVAGIGADWMVGKFLFSDIIFGLEYRHYSFDTVRHFPVNVTFAPPIAFPGDVRDVRATLDVVSAKLTFKWTPVAAVVAKY
jgi:outer membrane immunogenic protein